MRLLIFTCSLNPASRSAQLAELALADGRTAGHMVELVSVAALNLPLCDGESAYDHPSVSTVTDKIRAASGIIFALPVYNYDVNAAAKNLIELSGTAWTGKIVGFICSAGGQGSYMSVMPFANSLMLDYRCHIIPRFVYAAPSHIDESTFGDEAVNQRIEELAVETQRVTEGLFPGGE